MEKERPKVGIGVLVFNDKGKVLFMHRISKHAHNTWAGPGGWLEFGETFEKAAKREVKEELNLDIRDIKVVGVTNHIYKDEGKQVVTVFVKANKFTGEPKIMEPNKCSKFGWFDLGKLPEPLMPSVKMYLESNSNFFCDSGLKYKNCHGK